MDATIIEAPSSTKNGAGQRDPEMHQVKKGNQYHFGMKLHIGVDAVTGLVHSLTTTPANVHDVTETHRLLHGGESRVWGDAGYVGVQKRAENQELTVDWQVAMKPAVAEAGAGEPGGISGKGQGLHPSQGGTSLSGREGALRLRQEPALAKAGVRYRGLAKNRERVALLLGLSNLKRGQRILAG